MSQVRFAKLEDIPALVQLGRQIHVESRYAWMQFDAGRLWASLESAISSKQHCLIVAHKRVSSQKNQIGHAALDVCHEQPIGILWACALSLPFTNEFTAQIDYLYVLPKYRGAPAAMKMLAGFRRWAQNREISEILVPNIFGSNDNCSTKMFSKLGLKTIGGMHSMWVERK